MAGVTGVTYLRVHLTARGAAERPQRVGEKVPCPGARRASGSWRRWVEGALQDTLPSVVFAGAVIHNFKVWEGKDYQKLIVKGC